MGELHFPWLGSAVLIPLIGAVCMWPLRNLSRSRAIATVFCGLTLLCAAGAWIDFASLSVDGARDGGRDRNSFLRFNPFVIDELNAPLLPLAALLHLTVMMNTLRTELIHVSFGSKLVSESLTLATLASRAPWLIILLLSLSVLPLLWDLRRRRQNSRVFLVHMVGSVALMCAGQLLMGDGSPGVASPLAGGGLLTVGALIRSGVCPLHCWMSDLFERATFGSALLFVTPMPGAYAVMRLIFPIAPVWALQSIAILSLATAVYAAGMALVQSDVRRFFCYVFLSHSSLVLAGLETATVVGLTGALYVWLSVGISLLGFGLALRCVEARTGRLTLDRFHGLSEHTPFLAGMFLLTGLASIGFPGTVGFIGMELLVEGAVKVDPLVGLAVVFTAALNGVAVVKAYFHVFTGTRHSATVDMSCRGFERMTIVVMVLLILGGGLLPQPGVESRYHAARALLQRRENADHPAPAPSVDQQTVSLRSSS